MARVVALLSVELTVSKLMSDISGLVNLGWKCRLGVVVDRLEYRGFKKDFDGMV